MSTFVTECELRELWRNGRGEIPAFPPQTRFSASALDFLKGLGLHPATEASPRVSATSAPERAGEQPSRPPLKPSPRTKLQLRLQSLEALALLAAAQARRFGLKALVPGADAIAACCRELKAAEGEGRPVASLTGPGSREESWTRREAGAEPAGPDAHEFVHWLNLFRAQALEAAVATLEAYPPDWPELLELGLGLADALERVSGAASALASRLEAAGPKEEP